MSWNHNSSLRRQCHINRITFMILVCDQNLIWKILVAKFINCVWPVWNVTQIELRWKPPYQWNSITKTGTWSNFGHPVLTRVENIPLTRYSHNSCFEPNSLLHIISKSLHYSDKSIHVSFRNIFMLQRRRSCVFTVVAQ